MKKLLIIVIVILLSILVGQIAYYNHEKSNNDKIANQINNNINFQDINNISSHIDNLNNINTNEFIVISTDEVMPEDFDRVGIWYMGNLDLNDVVDKLTKFVYEYAQTIHEQTTGRPNNYKLQYYEEHEEEINNMGIYSVEDYSEISRQINLLKTNDTYKSSKIDTSSYEQTEDGYTKFKITLTYKSNKTIKLYVYIANDSETMPNIKFLNGE